MSVRYQFEKIVIVGVGLIGGSLARVVKHKRIAGIVVGVTKSRESLEKALKLGVIDQGTNSLGEALPGADLVVLATPVKTLERQFRELRNSAGPSPSDIGQPLRGEIRGCG